MSSPAVATEPRWWGPAGATARAAVLAVLLFPVSWSGLGDSGIGAGWLWVLRIAVVGLHALLLPPLVTRAPLVAFGLGSVIMLVLVAGPDLAGPMSAQAGGLYAPVLLPSSLVWFVLLYEVAARTSAPWPSAALGVGAVGGVVTVVRLWDATDYTLPISGDWPWRLFVTAAVAGGTVAAWALGRYRATRMAWSATLAERAVADERRRIAREMHDVVAHSLAVVVAQAEAGRMAVSNRPERAPEVLGTIATTGREALDQMRGLLGVLRDEPVTASPGATAEAPAPTLDDLPALLDQVRSAGLAIRLTEHGTPRRLGAAAELTAYRIVQESLTNVVRHAGLGASAAVALDWTHGLVVTVTDDGGSRVPAASRSQAEPGAAGGAAGATVGGATVGGAGATVGAARAGGGRGLAGMRERLASVGGELSEAGPAGRGWRMRARIPS